MQTNTTDHPQKPYPINEGVFDCGAVPLQCGLTLPATRILWRSYGTLNADKSNVIVYPTSYSAKHTDTEWLIGPDHALDPTRWFIVIPNMLCNGLSSSPSTHTTPPYNGSRFPDITPYDNVLQQRRLLKQVFDIERVALVYGWSMGAQQAYHWGALFGDAVERIAICCGSARTGAYNQVFLRGVEATLTADSAFQNGWFHQMPVAGLRAMGRVYAGWALSEAFYRNESWRTIGFASLEDFLIGSWEGNFLHKNANDLLWQLRTWMQADISANERFGHNLGKALSAISAHTLLMPGATDAYFRVDDNQQELQHLPRGELKVIPSDWGHRAGNPVLQPDDTAFINSAVTDLLAKPA